MDVTAVILSREPLSEDRLSIPGLKVLNYVSQFCDSEGLLSSRIESLRQVQTRHFLFLDDDDALPTDHLSVIEECLAASMAVAYTDELVLEHSGSYRLRKAGDYSEARFLEDPTLIHHLAVCDTDEALRCSRILPTGPYSFENLMYFQLAKRGAHYVERVGYLWNRRLSGLSHTPGLVTAQVRSSIWSNMNRG